MEFSHVVEPAPTTNVDLLVIVVLGDPNKDPLFRLVDTATKKGLSEAARSERRGQARQSHVVDRWHPARRVMVIGAGAKGELDIASLRDVGAAAAQQANKVGAKRVALVAPALGVPREAAAVQMLAEGAVLGTYKFGRYLTGADAKKPPSLQSFGIITDARGHKVPVAQARAVKAALERAQVVSAAVAKARDMINELAAL
jgi:leucyl aminopeptidase